MKKLTIVAQSDKMAASMTAMRDQHLSSVNDLVPDWVRQEVSTGVRL